MTIDYALSFRRWSLLTVAVALVIVSAVLTCTPVVWILAGRQAESYPELFFFLYWLPVAVLLLGDAVLLMFVKTRPGHLWLWASAWLKLGGIVATGLVWLPWGARHAPHTTQAILTVYHPVIVGGGLILTGIGLVQWLRTRGR